MRVGRWVIDGGALSRENPTIIDVEKRKISPTKIALDYHTFFATFVLL